MTAVVAVAVGGAIGALLRALLADLAARRADGDWPWGTLLANLLGSFLLGLLVTRFDGAALLLLGVGVMGALTTFSTAMADTVRLAEFDGRRKAAGYALATLGGAIVAAWAGSLLGG
jgi:CrcB protein